MPYTNDNAILKQYHEACEEIKKLEALKAGLKAHMLKVVSKGKIETVDYVATISQFTEKRLGSNHKDETAVEALVKRFGLKAMRPFIKTNRVKKVTVSRKAEVDSPAVVVHGGKKLEFT